MAHCVSGQIIYGISGIKEYEGNIYVHISIDNEYEIMANAFLKTDKSIDYWLGKVVIVILCPPRVQYGQIIDCFIMSNPYYLPQDSDNCEIGETYNLKELIVAPLPEVKAPFFSFNLELINLSERLSKLKFKNYEEYFQFCHYSTSFKNYNVNSALTKLKDIYEIMKTNIRIMQANMQLIYRIFKIANSGICLAIAETISQYFAQPFDMDGLHSIENLKFINEIVIYTQYLNTDKEMMTDFVDMLTCALEMQITANYYTKSFLSTQGKKLLESNNYEKLLRYILEISPDNHSLHFTFKLLNMVAELQLSKYGGKNKYKICDAIMEMFSRDAVLAKIRKLDNINVKTLFIYFNSISSIFGSCIKMKMKPNMIKTDIDFEIFIFKRFGLVD